MEILLLLGGIGFLVWGYQWVQDRRDNALAERLAQRVKGDPSAAAAEIDAARARLRAEGEMFARIRDHRR